MFSLQLFTAIDHEYGNTETRVFSTLGPETEEQKTFRLVSSSNTFQMLLLFVQGQGQKGKQKHTTKKFVRFQNHCL